MFTELETAAVGTRRPLSELLTALRFDERGLIPVVAQQHDSGEVLMLAWMNAATLAETLASGQLCYYSRSRRRPWRKGETSGHVQRLVELRVDCDGDTLLALVDQAGVACHTGRRSCFYTRTDQDGIEVFAPVEIDPADVYGA